MNALLSNPFKRGLLRGETQIGLWLSSTSSYMAEIAATSGYDWLLIDGEHAPNTIQDLYHQLQAIAPYASQPVIRPVEGNRSLIKQVLDIGARTLLVPMVDTAEQAREVVSATRYPPIGSRGVGAGVARAAGFLAVDPAMAEKCLAWGANFVAVGVDTMLYTQALDRRLAMFKSASAQPQEKTSY